MPAAVPGVVEAREAVLRALRDGAATVALTGLPGAGKSATLHALRVGVGDAPWGKTLAISPPSAEDAGPIALLEAAAQLGEWSPPLLKFVKDIQQPWGAKVDAVLQELRKHAADTLLLIDDPFTHEPDSSSPTTLWKADNLQKSLVGVPGIRCVIATSRPTSFRPSAELTVRAASQPDTLLASSVWGPLAASAAALARERRDMSRLSPLDVRLRVALVALGVPAHDAASEPLSVHRLVRRVMDLLPRENQGAFRKLVGRLALVRTPFDEALLRAVGGAGLSQREYCIVRQALVFGDNDELRLHEVVARQAVDWEWLQDAELREAHQLLAREHQRLFEVSLRVRQAASTIRHEAEIIHHLTDAGDASSILARSVFFVEQYDALGRALSQDKRFDDAVTIYERSLAHDSTNDYAHHYLAYNLDVLAREPARVESEFRAALDLRSDHPWYWTRYVNFLVTRGRTRDARAAWETAATELSGASESEHFFRELHGEVARLLLHRGQLEFAHAVIDDIIPGVRARPWARALRTLLAHLEEAARNEVVFPPHIDADERWKAPHLLYPNERYDSVVDWLPGRVADVDGGAVHIRTARAKEGGDVDFGWLDIAERDFIARLPHRVHETLPAGSFVEFITFSSSDNVLRIYPRTRASVVADLPPLFPHPDRYIRRAP